MPDFRFQVALPVDTALNELTLATHLPVLSDPPVQLGNYITDHTSSGFVVRHGNQTGTLWQVVVQCSPGAKGGTRGRIALEHFQGPKPLIAPAHLIPTFDAFSPVIWNLVEAIRGMDLNAQIGDGLQAPLV